MSENGVGGLSELLNAFESKAKNVSSKRDCCEALTFLSESLKRQEDKKHSSSNGNGNTDAQQSDKDFNDTLLMFKEENLAGAMEKITQRANTLDHGCLEAVAMTQLCDRSVEVLISSIVSHASSHVHPSPNSLPPSPLDSDWVTSSSPARVDLAGAWTDTPPICTDYGGKVVGAAVTVDGKNPIGCKVKRTTRLHFHITESNQLGRSATFDFDSVDEMSDYDNPASDAAVIKACVAFVGLQDMSKTNYGLEIVTWSNLPVGSGMGTSSILSGCVIAVLWTAAGTKYTYGDIMHAVLIVEQMLTTGGGWQDQVNGLYPGIKLGQSSKSEKDLLVTAKRIRPSEEFVEKLASHMLLVFTGKVRLAKNLLRTVIAQWYEGTREIVETIERNYVLADEMVNAIKEENLESVGKILSEFWTLKRTLAKGSEPEYITEIFYLLKPICLGQSLCGAGGGGFMVVLTRNPNSKSEVEELLKKRDMG